MTPETRARTTISAWPRDAGDGSEASEQELRRAVELDPDYADANFNLAVLYLRRTPPLVELAHRHYQRALDLGTARDPLIEGQLAKAVASQSTPASPSANIP